MGAISLYQKFHLPQKQSQVMPQRVVSHAIDLDTLLLAIAMGALGLCTHVSAIRKAGYKPLLLGGVLFAWLLLGGSLINRLVMAWI